MSNTNNNSEIKCSDIRQILIKKNYEKLGENLICSLHEHLISCPDCQQFEHSLMNVQSAMKITSKDKMLPDPKIRTFLVNRLKKEKMEKQNIFSVVSHRIWKILDFRIPVYQGIIGFAIIILIFLGLNNSQLWDSQPSVESFEYTPVEQLNQVNVINSLKFIQEQKIGKTVQEDTILTHLLYTVM